MGVDTIKTADQGCVWPYAYWRRCVKDWTVWLRLNASSVKYSTAKVVYVACGL